MGAHTMTADVSEGYSAVMKFVSKLSEPERDSWLRIVRACCELTNRSGHARFAKRWLGGQFATARFSLRRLCAHRILEKDGVVVRGGRRAYWRMRDPEGVGQALSELGY